MPHKLPIDKYAVTNESKSTTRAREGLGEVFTNLRIRIQSGGISREREQSATKRKKVEGEVKKKSG
jgi:hypothetical protein